MSNNYDPVARYYDFLSRVVFGRTEIDAQVEMLRYVRPGDRLLIVGGGTGWILEKIVDCCASDLQITYVEPSRVMMRQARRRHRGDNAVSFVQLPVEQFSTGERFDCILTGFVFDNFTQDHSAAIVRSLDALLVAGGHWLYADLYYYPGKGGSWWHGLMLRSMYWTARWICKVEANCLPDMEGCFAQVGYTMLSRASYYQGFIQSIVYQKA
jgi:hypothetical protein